MIPNPERAKGSGPLLGASGPGGVGPYGPYGAEDGQDDGLEPDTLDPVAAVNTRVAQLVAAARARRERRDRQRQALEAARQHGVAARHRAKLARGDQDQPPPDAA